MVFLDTFQVEFRENYGLENPKLPLAYPPPKYGAAFAMQNSSLMIVGGASSSNFVGNDRWTWDAGNFEMDIRTIIDSKYYLIMVIFINTLMKDSEHGRIHPSECHLCIEVTHQQ